MQKWRTQLDDPLYKKCWLCPSVKPEMNHGFIYAGRQIEELWAISALCKFDHTEDKKSFHKCKETKEKIHYLCLKRANITEIQAKYPKFNWLQYYKYLSSKYENTI